MNLRKNQLADLITDKLETLSIKDDDLIIIRLPNGLPATTSSMVGQSIVDSLRALNKGNPVILLPYEVQIEHIDEKDMNELGWIKDVKTTERNTSNNRLPELISSPKVTIPLDEQRRIWEREVTELLRKLQDTRTDPPGANTSGYIGTSLF